MNKENYQLDENLKIIKEKAQKWDEFKTPKGVVLGETEGCYPYGDCGEYEVSTALNCPNCNEAVGESNDDDYKIWCIHCPNCGQMIEPLSDEEIDRINELFEEAQQ